MTKARDIADFKFENIVDTGTEGTKVATGTTAQRGSTEGQFRYNSTTGKFEGRNADGFLPIEGVPTISGIDVSNILETEIASGKDITVTGTNFDTGITAKFIGQDGTEYSAPSVTRNSSTSLTVRVSSSVSNANEPFDVSISNPNGLSAVLSNCFNVNAKPIWQTASGSIYTGESRIAVSVTVSATDPESDTITYSEVTSALSTAGLTLNSSTGAITGTPNPVVSNTVYSITLRATSGTQTSDRDFTITITPPQVQVLVVGGGGSGGYTAQGWVGGGGGSGGIAYHSGYSISLGSSYSVIVGQGGGTTTTESQGGSNVAESGSNSSFDSTVIAYGGGGGSGYSNAYTIGASGGSGGGSEGGQHNQSQGASATQGTGGTSHYGERGGIGSNGTPNYQGGGGGGTGEAGDTDGITYGGDGTSDFDTWLNATSQGVLVGATRYIAGGGGAGASGQNSTSSTGGLGGDGGGGQGGNSSGSSGTAGTANTGSGGGGRGLYNVGSGVGGAGGSGLVIVRYAGSQIAGSTGGTIVESGGYTYHTFTSSGTLSI